MDADWSNWQSLDSQGPLHSATARTASAVRLAAREFSPCQHSGSSSGSIAQLSLRGTYIWSRISLAVFSQEKTLTKAGWAQCKTPFESTAFQLTDVCNFICRRIILNQESSLQGNNSRKGVLIRRNRVSLLFVNLPQSNHKMQRFMDSCCCGGICACQLLLLRIITHHDTSPHIVI